MRDKGKTVDVYRNIRRGGGSGGDGVDDPFVDYYYDYDDGDGSSGLPCRKHPGASSVGICAFCLKDRLVKLVCSDCGEQRLSSCSCSDDISSNRNSCTVDVGSVGRISFLIENEETARVGAGELRCPNTNTNVNPKAAKAGGDTLLPLPDRVFVLKRSSSSCVEIKKTNGIGKIGRLFRKKKQKAHCDNNGGHGQFIMLSDEIFFLSFLTALLSSSSDSKSEMWVADGGQMGGAGTLASRSRSLNSLRGCGVFGSEDGDWTFSGARSSISGARPSSVNGAAATAFDSDRKSGFSETELRRSAFSEAETRRSTAFNEAEPPRKSGLSETFKEPRKSSAIPEDHHYVAAASYNSKPNRRIFSLRESEFTGVDEKGFIDLKFFSSSETRAGGEHPSSDGGKTGLLVSSKSEFGSSRTFQGFIGGGEEDFSSGSCRITVTDRGFKKSRRSFKEWRWVFFGQYPKKKDQDSVRVVS
ncbi:hypothetical protein SAY87_028920 [Trapa incisa]|uniref:Uncharacterized protein n=1 Tax=Trapa incisa TaxID=236973 RepID=A0AAN7L335_9MYRT|nr:hypothetical protein SAY87_028920 [Trapa incisa]